MRLSVPGNQTVPRAELVAVCVVLEIATAPLIEIITDAAYIIRGVLRGPNFSARPNWDLWRRFWAAVDARGGIEKVNFRKINSH